MVLSKGVLENLNRIQHMVARCILQLPKSSARIAGALDAGFMQMKDGYDTNRDVCMEYSKQEARQNPQSYV